VPRRASKETQKAPKQRPLEGQNKAPIALRRKTKKAPKKEPRGSKGTKTGNRKMPFRAPKRETPKKVQIKTIKDPRMRAKKSLGSLKNTPKRYPGPKKAPTVPKKGSSRESLMKDKAQHN
jgi:hypothetical protein